MKVRQPPSRVFISSTVRDLADYRVQLKEALEAFAKGALHCNLSEDWANPFADVTRRVQQVLETCEAYYGIFAHYYGSCPRGQARSITRIEFERAVKLWGAEDPPFIAVFVPELGSKIDRELAKAARRILNERYPRAKTKRDEQWGRQRQFLRDVENSGRTVTRFGSGAELVSRAQIIYRDWGGELLLAARRAAPERAGSREPTKVELGRLGRDPQRARFRQLLAEMNLAGARALAVVVQGGEEMGHEHFAEALRVDVLSAATCIGGRPMGRFDANMLAAWMLACLQKRPVARPFSSLCDVLRTTLETRPVHVVLTKIGDYAGGLPAFTAEFWAPLSAALGSPATGHPLVFLLLDPGSEAPEEDAPAAPDFACPIPISLTSITANQLMQWFLEHEVPDHPPTRLKDLAHDVLSKTQGEATPETLFRRLARAGLWP